LRLTGEAWRLAGYLLCCAQFQIRFGGIVASGRMNSPWDTLARYLNWAAGWFSTTDKKTTSLQDDGKFSSGLYPILRHKTAIISAKPLDANDEHTEAAKITFPLQAQIRQLS